LYHSTISPCWSSASSNLRKSAGRWLLIVVAADRPLRKNHHAVAQLLQRDVGAVAANHADLLQPLGSHQAGALAEADSFGQLDIRAAALPLQVREDLEVEAVERHGVGHARMVAPDG